MKCPVCKSTDIGEVRGDNGIDGPGYNSWLQYRYCKRCGVMLHPLSKDEEQEPYPSFGE